MSYCAQGKLDTHNNGFLQDGLNSTKLKLPPIVHYFFFITLTPCEQNTMRWILFSYLSAIHSLFLSHLLAHHAPEILLHQPLSQQLNSKLHPFNLSNIISYTFIIVINSIFQFLFISFKTLIVWS